MYLQKLELNGFKSFAKKTLLEFDPHMTAIVGPNGSGKSNITEAIKWVMGEQSLKSLRGKRSTDVVFSGSDKVTRLGMAEVSLFFDNKDNSAPVDYSEIVIMRRIHRDGRGEYAFNNHNTRLQDVQLLLAKMNLSSKTYSVISQGMVDMILSISATERKEFFEEASGVKPLRIKKNEAVRKLTTTKDNMETIEIQLGEIKPRLNSLTRQVKRLEKRAEIEKILHGLQYSYYGHILVSLHKQYRELEKQGQALHKKITAEEEQIDLLQERMRTLTLETSQSRKFDQLQKQYQEIFKEKTIQKEKEFTIKTQLLHETQHNKKTTIPISVLKNIYEEWSQYRNRLTEFETSLAGIASLNELNSWREQFLTYIAHLEKIWEPARMYLQENENANFKNGLKDVSYNIKELDKKLEHIQYQTKQLSETQKIEKEKIWETQNILQQHQQEFNVLTNQRNEVLVQHARIETRISDVETEIIDEVDNVFLKKCTVYVPDETLNDSAIEKIREQIQQYKHQLEFIGGIDPDIHSEYTETKKRHEFLSNQLTDINQSIKNLQIIIEELDTTIKQKFNTSFVRINKEFQKYFKILFEGGRAQLELVLDYKAKKELQEEQDSEQGLSISKSIVKDVEEKEIMGVEISATPPGKKLKSINMLSGGERALTSIALICAIIANNPAPFVVLDEVDAALDEANSLRFAHIIKELSATTQFIVVTHNRATMEQAQLLYGVTMGNDGISKLLSLKLDRAREYTNR